MLAETIIKITEFINEYNVPEEDKHSIAEFLDVRVCDFEVNFHKIIST